jgi:hypothetical protein
MLDLTYSQQTIAEYLKELEFSIIEPFINDELHMRGDIVTGGVIFDTIICIPKEIPPSYPTFHLVDAELEFKEPHVERPKVYTIEKGSKNIVCRTCIRDERDKVYSNSTVDLFYNLYKEFEGLCAKYANKEFDSKAELFEEFNSYWSGDFSFLWDIKETPNNFEILDIVTIKYKDTKDGYRIITDRVNEIREFANRTGYSKEEEKTIYIELSDDMPYPLPCTYGDLKKLLEDAGALQELKRHKKLINSYMICLGFNLPSGEKHIAIACLPPVSTNGKKVKKVDITSILTSEPHTNRPFKGGNPISLDLDYILSRGGHKKNTEISDKRKKIAIVGCGSVGSTLAYKLSKSGIRDFVLIDPARLKPENIGRHQLGMSDIIGHKAEAMAKHLKSQFIGLSAQYINCKVENDDAIAALKDVDLIITAIGSDAPAVEPWMSKQSSEGLLPEMLTCWLEADGICGHILRTKKGKLFDFNKTCDNLNILDFGYSSKLLISEVGCNSTYMPYSFLDADSHINKMAHFVLSIINDDNDFRAMSSIGDTSKYEDKLIKQVAKWSTIEYDMETLPL